MVSERLFRKINDLLDTEIESEKYWKEQGNFFMDQDRLEFAISVQKYIIKLHKEYAKKELENEE
jgi:hypothetical protein|tara:strand:+ start:5717 stop:5908 length:192 start_codon:yes stop_codon:yes gene_type:complete